MVDPSGSAKEIEENLELLDCTNSTPARFKKQKYSHWYDPANWKSLLEFDDNFSAIPHLQRVPCRYDEVVFPSEAAYKVTITIGGICLILLITVLVMFLPAST
jgi:hypothetical protein